ncbi:MAG TPA: cyclic pyranopterin monophosphate synthase MoaC [Planctomycetes bacterium]|nr:cyclic pyranopterin monophosphate synthase MoaC [Planctomycetaceae bacterium]HIN94119.1 cyclic pyranopterin monophosphate synthase MoaC [Planctomycetota bacterium]
MSEFTHFNEDGASRMVDVGSKKVTERMARAVAILEMQPETLQQIRDRKLSKGDVLEVARLAGIMSAKRTADLIPLCHPLAIDAVTIEYEFPGPSRLRIESQVAVTARTGVEMEALVAASTTALTVYDMCKSVDRGMVLRDLHLLEKKGGRSGHFVHPDKGS